MNFKFSAQINVLPAFEYVKFKMKFMYQSASFLRKPKIERPDLITRGTLENGQKYCPVDAITN